MGLSDRFVSCMFSEFCMFVLLRLESTRVRFITVSVDG